jgi:phosphate transport system substrate-binding protein
VKASRMTALAASSALAAGVAACGGGGGAGGEPAPGEIRTDGSSTVAPLSESIGAMYSEQNPDASVTVGTSGTGGGFERFCAGETDIANASRQIEPEEEQICEDNGVEYEELTVANDALSVVVNPDNPVTCVAPDALSEAVYGPDATATSWSDVETVEGGEFDETLEIFSPGSDSGTFDYFTEAVNGEEGAQRTEGVNVVGEDDNATVTGVAGSPGGIGYFGYSFYNENRDELKALEIENEDGDCVAPSEETAQSGDYNPLGRELYIYASREALERPQVEEYVQYYLDNANEVAPDVGFIALTDEQLEESQSNLENLLGGGSGGGGSDSGEGGSGGTGSESE